MLSSDEKFMFRCLQLAKKGLGHVAPNPMVGSVIVHKGIIIGEGYHQQFGKAHAEVNAINSVLQKSLLASSVLYVNLEPCAHFGKTPPCTHLIKEKKIPKVVIGCLDSFREVAGKGKQYLMDSGIDVIMGCLEDESRALNCRFFTFNEKKRPYIILKWAQTSDGYIAPSQLEKAWITNESSVRIVHKWRTEEQAVMVGTHTAQIDNPQLTAREWEGANPMRIVLDRTLKLPPQLKLFDSLAATLVFNEVRDEKRKNIEFIKVNFNKHLLFDVLDNLYRKNIQSLIVEGGKELLNSFIEMKLWDEARVFTGEKEFGNGLKAPVLDSGASEKEIINGDVLKVFHNNAR